MKQGKVVSAIVLVALALLVVLPSWAVVTAQDNPTAMPSPNENQTMSAAERPYLGIRLEDTPYGAVVREVIPGSPAADAGIQVDDLLERIDLHAISNVYQAMSAIDSRQTTDTLDLGVRRNGETQSLMVHLQGIKPSAAELIPSSVPFDAITYDAAAQSWNVRSVAAGSDLFTAGLRTGDVLTHFNDTAYTPNDYQVFLSNLADSAMVKVTVERDGKTQDFQVTAATLRALNLLGYGDEGMLFQVVPPVSSAANTTATVQLNPPALPFNMPYDAISYDSAAHNWLVTGLEENGVLYMAGLRTGDLITQFDGNAYTPAELQTYRESLHDSATVRLSVDRAGSTVDVNVIAGDLNVLDLFNSSDGAMLFGMASSRAHTWLGADTSTVTTQFAQLHQLAAHEGAAVLGIMPDSPAARAGLRVDDVITGINQASVNNTGALQSALAAHHAGDKITLDVQRGTDSIKIDATLGEPDISGEIPFLVPPL